MSWAAGQLQPVIRSIKKKSIVKPRCVGGGGGMIREGGGGPRETGVRVEGWDC